MNPRHCHLNLRKESQEAFALTRRYQAPDLRKKWRTAAWNGILVGLGLVFFTTAYLTLLP